MRAFNTSFAKDIQHFLIVILSCNFMKSPVLSDDIHSSQLLYNNLEVKSYKLYIST